MTTEMQTFVGLKDIIGLRFKCHGCHAKFIMPLELSKSANSQDPWACSHCGEQWFQGTQDQRLMALRSFLKYFRDLQETKMAFDLTLELANPAARAIGAGA